MQLQTIQNLIYDIRDQKVMLDFDIAELYKVETRVLNQAIKRNIERFPKDFMFRLTAKEWKMMSSQIVMTYSKKRPNTALPHAFTEQGVAMLSGILNSDKAIAMNIAIMRAFVEIRKILIQENDLKEQLKAIKERLGEHDAQLNQIYDAMENLLDEKIAQRNWEDRKRIGFNVNGQ